MRLNIFVGKKCEYEYSHRRSNDVDVVRTER